jgi:DNA primase small subunit
MKIGSKILLKQLFKEYYFMMAERVAEAIPEIGKREICYTDFEEGRLIRHLSMNNERRLADFVIERVPKDLYHSSAYYLFPEREMHQKEWMGADLVFDIDIDHIEDKEKKGITLFQCRSCGEISPEKGELCPHCGGGVRGIEWLGEESLEVAKREVITLIQVLEEELGFSQEMMQVYFSGGRGYHIHIYDSGGRIFSLSQGERNEIVDYLRLTGYRLRYESTWEKRTAKRMWRVLKGEEIPDNLNRGERETITRSLGDLSKMEGYPSRDEWKRILIQIPFEVQKKIEDYVKRKERVEIDPVVTSDTRRLIRAPASLHGKTGLVKRLVEDIDAFNPFLDAVGLPERPVTLYVKYSPQISFKGREYGPYEKEIIEAPSYVAAYLIGKGVADA